MENVRKTKKISQRSGDLIKLMAYIPLAALIDFILEPFRVSESTILTFQIIFISVQLIGLGLLIRHRKELF